MTIVEEDQARKKMMRRLKYGKKRERANMQANQKKEERIRTTTNIWVKASKTLFYSFFFARRCRICFFCFSSTYNTYMTRTVLHMPYWDRNYFFHSPRLSKYVFDTISTHIYIHKYTKETHKKVLFMEIFSIMEDVDTFTTE